MTGEPLLDSLMANAWPPLEEQRRGDWRCRWTLGLTRRANSALAIGGDSEMQGMVEWAEEFYTERHAPVRFLVSSASAPPGLSALLAARDYTAEARTLMMATAARDLMGRPANGTWELTVEDRVGDPWFDAYWSVASSPVRGRAVADAGICRSVLLASELTQRFVAAKLDGTVAATGQVVFDAGWAGLQCMATRPAFRRRGAASAVLGGLASAAAQAGADGLYLAVEADHLGAIALYQQWGFSVVHDYRYWVRPPSSG